ncbi:MAG: T9SS type A sorting domain-containing protein [Bacteroidia bacterium]|nr:T9SS type A sorting domain-containing protein [Bacteroidia bacterium]
MKRKNLLSAVFLLMLSTASAQIPNCDMTVPTFNIDFTSATTDSTWTSPFIVRDGNCCATVPPDRCVDFVITTGVQTVAIVFNICLGPLPSGSINYQMDCGPMIVYGDTAFITTPGIHYLTFCKPGTGANDYCITAVVDTLTTDINPGSFSYMPDAMLTWDMLNGNHFLNLNLSSPSSFTLNIFSVDGKKVSERNYSMRSGRQQIPINTENLPRGIYFCRVTGDNNFQNKSFKFVK